jgi:hypothetical protein
MSVAFHRRLRVLANLTLAYPVLVVAIWYGEWFFAWYILGRQPIPWEDDPVSMVGSAGCMYFVTFVSLIGILPIGATAVIANVWHIAANGPTAVQAGIRLQTLVALWLGMWILVFTDPYYPIGKWWID